MLYIQIALMASSRLLVCLFFPPSRFRLTKAHVPLLKNPGSLVGGLFQEDIINFVLAGFPAAFEAVPIMSIKELRERSDRNYAQNISVLDTTDAIMWSVGAAVNNFPALILSF